MMKKLFCMLLALGMLFTSSAMAMTFDEGVAFMLDMVRTNMEAQGRTYVFTECDAAQNQRFSKAFGHEYHVHTSRDGETFCAVRGHDGMMEIFTAETLDRDAYEDMLASALIVMQAYLQAPSRDMIRWVNEKGAQVLAKSGEDVAFLYELKDGAFFLMEQIHETNAARQPHYSVSMVFPCESCVMTRIVESMRQDAQIAGGSR